MQHDWIKSTLGHGDAMCSRCLVTNREASAIGIMHKCDAVADMKPEEHVRVLGERGDEIETLRGLLKEARQYVADAGSHEEPGEHQAKLLADIDAILI